MQFFRFVLKASRPGLWFQTLWLYLLPAAGADTLFPERFWLGVAFVLLPLNLLVYGWNDLVDESTDALNPRKDSFLFGARGRREELARLPLAISVVNLPLMALLIYATGFSMILVLLGMIGMVAIYNLPQRGLRARPPLELLNQLGYLLILPLSYLLNGLSPLPWQSLLYLVLFCTHAHIMGEILDVEPDRKAGRQTTATWIGIIPAKWIVAGLVLLEAILITWIFRDWVLGGFLFFGTLILILDIVVHGAKSYTHSQFVLLGAGLNLAGFGSMAWVWFTGTLTHLPSP